MILKCIVVDDEKRARNILKSYIDDVEYLEFVKDFKNAIEAINFSNSNSVHVVFLDINMPKLSGIKAAKMFGSAEIIFTTAHREFALEGFELNVTDYLLKPIPFERFLNAVQRIPRLSKDNRTIELHKNYIDVKVGKLMTRIGYHDLLFAEGLGNYLKIITTKETLVSYKKLSELEELLPKQFVRVHKSYIINFDKISSYTKDYISIGKKHIPIGIKYKSLVSSLLIK